ncbi:MAG: PIN domain-containing protein [Planctomycetota bacterium]
MHGYLLDTNIVEYWFNDKAPQHASVENQISSQPDGTPILISTVTLGEIEYGHRAVADEPTAIQVRFKEFLDQHFPYHLDVKHSTAPPYGELRARLFSKYSPADKRKKIRRPEQLSDPASGLEIGGIQENDLWIAAQAIEHNLILVTNDKMNSIKAVASSSLRIENWASDSI